jgi:hypothetical protein
MTAQGSDQSVSMSAAMTRRQLLVAALLPFALGLPNGLASRSRSVIRWVQSRLFPDVRAAATVGDLYLQKQPEEGSAARLAYELFGSDSFRNVDREGDERLRQRLRASRDLDFRRDDLVVLHGWVVTRTEARLLALLSLSAPRKEC